MNKELFILFVDDEQHILDALTRSLRKWLKEIKLEALTANSAHAAMNIISQHTNDIAVIVSDQRMPDLNGSALTRVITKKSPDTMIIILSGHSTLEDMNDIIGSGVFSFLQKPWNKETLQAEIRKGYEFFKLKRENRMYNERQKKDFQMAGDFQKSFLQPKSPIGERIRFKNTYLPFSDDCVSGDYYDFYELKHNRYVILIGDVANRGMKAALVTPFLKSMVYENYIINRKNETLSPGKFLRWLNNKVCYFLSKNPELYISFTAICVDLNRNVVIAANAGSPPSFLVHNEKISSIKPEGLVLGYEENQEYEESIIDIHENDTLIMFTDGLFTHRDENNQLSESELIKIIQETQDPEDHEELLKKVRITTGQECWNDDLTLLTVKVL